MGKKVILFDDIDGTESPDVLTRYFAIGNKRYEIDLTHDNYEDFLHSFGVYVAAAREVEEAPAPAASRPRRPRRKVAAKAEPTPEATEEIVAEVVPEPAVDNSPAKTPTEVLDADIRKWARDNGYQVGDRGRLPNEVIHGYREHQRRNRPVLQAVNGAHG